VSQIAAARARSVYDSRGRPTIEVEITTSRGRGRAIAPAGASTGRFEARERRDADGLGVEVACRIFRDEIAPLLVGRDCLLQAEIDRDLVGLDGSPHKARLGGNTLIATSLAVLDAAAAASGVPLWQHVARSTDRPDADLRLPMPEIQIIGGGAHAHGRIDLQDLMVVPIGARDWAEALRWCADVYRASGRRLAEQGRLRGVADEGGFFPELDGNEAALSLLTEAIEAAGLRPGEQVVISIDVAATQFFADGHYRLRADDVVLEPAAWVERLAHWCRKFPIALVEDPLSEDDGGHWTDFHAAAPQCRIVGDDLVVTDAARIHAAAAAGRIGAALVKPNQAGTVSEAHAALLACRASGCLPIVSARSGESEDVSIVHLAVGWGAPMLKVGSITRGERTAKWNEGLRIAEGIANAALAGID
jgi:enolase